MKKTKKMMTAVLSLLMVLSVCFTSIDASAAVYDADKAASFVGSKEETYEMLKNLGEGNLERIPAFEYGQWKEWDILNLARSGMKISEEQKQAYCNSVERALNDSDNDINKKYAELAKVSMVLKAMNIDPTNFKGQYNLIEKMKGLLADPNAYWNIYSMPYVVIALHATGTDATEYVNWMMTEQTAEGGFPKSWTDVDTTAMVLHGLSLYSESNATVKAACDKAVNYFAAQFDKTSGLFMAYGSPSVESASYAALALIQCGVDLTKDERFINNDGNNLMQNLYVHYDKANKGFTRYNNAGGNTNMTTYEATHAFIAYDRVLNGKTAFFDLTDVDHPHNYELKKDEAEGITETKPTVTLGENKDIEISIDCPYDKFVGLKDAKGNWVDESLYDARPGSTIITFKKELLNTLTPGAQTFTAQFTDGVAPISFTVAKKEVEQKPVQKPATKPETKPAQDKTETTTAATTTTEAKSPKTGETFPYAVAVLAFAAAGLAVVSKKRVAR